MSAFLSGFSRPTPTLLLLAQKLLGVGEATHPELLRTKRINYTCCFFPSGVVLIHWISEDYCDNHNFHQYYCYHYWVAKTWAWAQTPTDLARWAPRWCWGFPSGPRWHWAWMPCRCSWPCPPLKAPSASGCSHHRWSFGLGGWGLCRSPLLWTPLSPVNRMFGCTVKMHTF